MSVSVRNGTRELQRLQSLKYYNVLKWEKYIHFRAECCQKYRLYRKKASSKDCLELNCQQKTQWMHMSIPPWSGARGLERVI